MPENEQSILPVPDGTRKKPTQSVTAAVAAPAKDSASEVPPLKVTKNRSKKDTAANIALRDPLPSHKGRNEHPGQQKGIEKKIQQTKAQIAADHEAEKKKLEEMTKKEDAVKRRLVELNLTEQREAEAQLEASRGQPEKAPANEKVAHLSIGSDEEEFPWSEVEDSESEVEVIEKVSN